MKIGFDDCISAFSSDTPIIITGDVATPAGRVSIYPNPADQYLIIRGLTGEITGSHILDMTGRMSPAVLEKHEEGHRTNVDNLTPGIYLLRIQQADGVSQVKFIKK